MGFVQVENGRLDYQRLFRKGACAPPIPQTHGWMHEDSFVSLSQSDMVDILLLYLISQRRKRNSKSKSRHSGINLQSLL